VDEMSTVPVRIPVADYREIKKIGNELNIKIGAAYQIWKKRKGIITGIKWRET
jgi:hypothetical protein